MGGRSGERNSTGNAFRELWLLVGGHHRSSLAAFLMELPLRRSAWFIHLECELQQVTVG